MKSAPDLSYVLPAYNEEENIEMAVRDANAACREFCSSWEIVVVDDGSRDGTPEILARLESEIPELRTIRVEPNRGYTNALRTGFLASTRPWVFYTDGDNQFDPREMARFLAIRKDADLVIGYRVGRKDGILRLLLSRTYNNLQKLYLGLRVRDINCAFKLFRRPFFDVAPIDSDGFLVDAEILIRAQALGLRVLELPVGHRPRIAGRTSVNWKAIPQTLREMRRLRKILAGWPTPEVLRSLPSIGLLQTGEAGQSPSDRSHARS